MAEPDSSSLQKLMTGGPKLSSAFTGFSTIQEFREKSPEDMLQEITSMLDAETAPKAPAVPASSFSTIEEFRQKSPEDMLQEIEGMLAVEERPDAPAFATREEFSGMTTAGMMSNIDGMLGATSSAPAQSKLVSRAPRPG
jgi:hypothetical protein